jgi:hypothetical protein
MRIPFLAAALIAVASVAEADTITINASDFAHGTNITQALVGSDITLQRLTTAGTGTSRHVVSSDVFASGVMYGTSADVGFGGASSASGYDLCRRLNWTAFGDCGEFGAALEVTFLTPTDYISIDSINGFDYSMIHVYSTSGEHLQKCGSFGGPNQPLGCYGLTTTRRVADVVHTVSFQSDARNIGRVIFGGDGPSSWTDPVRISYGVPEPSALAALLLGAGGWSASRLRCRKAALRILSRLSSAGHALHLPGRSDGRDGVPIRSSTVSA